MKIETEAKPLELPENLTSYLAANLPREPVQDLEGRTASGHEVAFKLWQIIKDRLDAAARGEPPRPTAKHLAGYECASIDAAIEVSLGDLDQTMRERWRDPEIESPRRPYKWPAFAQKTGRDPLRSRVGTAAALAGGDLIENFQLLLYYRQ